MRHLKNGLLCLFLGVPCFLLAHQERPAFLQIAQIDQYRYDIFWKVPLIAGVVPTLAPDFGRHATLTMHYTARDGEHAQVAMYHLETHAPLQSQKLTIRGLDDIKMDVLVRVVYSNGESAIFLLDTEHTSKFFPEPARAIEVIKDYTILGIEHILFGVDHLLFVLALILITKSFKRIIKTITAFTLAHSITLSLATLKVIHIPAPPVEAVIALSIVFLALEILKNLRGERSLTGQKPWLVAFTFGLLHGFGFAGALAEVGLPQSAIPMALAFFNIGVELGQLFFVLIVVGVLRLLAHTREWPIVVQKLPAYSIGSIAMFWTIERVLGFWV